MTSTARQESAMAALAIANHIRTTNAKTLRDLKKLPFAEGCAVVADMLRYGDLSGPTGSIQISRLLKSVKSLGEGKLEDILYEGEVLRGHRPLRSLSPRQRELLADATASASAYSFSRR